MNLERAEIEAIFDALYGAYGAQGWWPGDTPFEVMAGAILTQRTAWHNVTLALANMRNAGLLDAETLQRAQLSDLEQAVRPAGFFRQKAVRLQALSAWLAASGGFAQATALSDSGLRDGLLGIKGVGPETADAITLYAFRRPVFVIDAYFRRVFSRIGLFDGTEPYDALRTGVERAMCATTEIYGEFHALIVTHAKVHCRTNPVCESCALSHLCEYARTRSAEVLH